MAYTTIKKPSDYFNTVLYTGNDSTQSITGVGFQPDLWWNKSRSGTHSAGVHCVYDSVRGTTKRLQTQSTAAEGTISGVTSFDSDGVTLGSENQSNGGSTNYVAWNWLANGAGVSNTDGTITSTVSVNTTSGFSIVSYTGTGANATVGHGLGSLPGMVIVKGRNTTSANHWFVFHQNSQSSYSASGSAILLLNASNAVDTIGVSGVWNNTSPTSSVFNIGTENGVNESGKDFIAYCFADVQGFSKFGSYTGNGNANGPFIYTGFKPAWVLFKKSSGINNWNLYDNKRNTFNPESNLLYPSLSDAEASFSGVDFVSNGISIKTNNTNFNDSGGTYIYMAFAEEPLVGDNPATAR